MLRTFTIAIFMAVVSFGAFGQGVFGVVREADTKEPIPFANIWIKGTQQGTQSDLDGRFSIATPKGDTLVISAVGFMQQDFLLKRTQKNELTADMRKDVKEIEHGSRSGRGCRLRSTVLPGSARGGRNNFV